MALRLLPASGPAPPRDITDIPIDNALLEYVTSSPASALIDIDRELVSRGGLRAFIELAWPCIEKDGTFVSNWHIDGMCEYLEAVSRGDIHRLAMAVPPRTMKSICVAVMWAAWDWIAHPERRFLFSSYAHNLAIRDSVRCRRIITSPWYQSRWGDRFKITSDQNTKIRFENDKNGYRLSTSVDGQLTGEGGDIVCCFPADQLIMTETGGRPIGEIVDQRARVRVWSYDTKTGRSGLKAITGWHRNPGRPILEISLSDGCKFRCTSDHRIWTKRGWVRADALNSSDVLPRQPAPNSLDRGFGDTKPSRQRASAHAARHNLDYLNFGELGYGMGRSARSVVAFPDVAGDAFPISASADVLDSLPANSIASTKDICAFRAGRNISSLGARKDRARALLKHRKSSVTLRVGDVLGARSIGQIVEDGIGPLAIQMPNLVPVRSWTYEGEHHDLMNEQMVGRAISHGVESRVTLMRRCLEESAGDRQRLSSSHDDSWYAPDPAERGDFVQPLEAGDRSPVLIKSDGHADVTFCLTITDYHTMMLFGDIIVSNCDDPHNVREAESEAVREGTLEWWRESMSTRLNDPKTGAFVLIQQRVHSRDLIGFVKDEPGWEFFCVPMEFEPDHPNRWIRDPRKEAGELLWPARMPRDKVDALKSSLGPYAAAAQLQQRPSPREGGLFKRKWLPITRDLPPGRIQWCRAWDFAASEKKLVKSDPDWTATALIGWARESKKWIVAEVLRWRVEPNRVRELVRQRAEQPAFGVPGRQIVQRIPQDPGQAGKDQAQQYSILLAGWNIHLEPQTGDKVTRAMGFAAQAAAGNVMLLEGGWNETFLAEITGFPNADHDDQVDASASAFNGLTGGGTAGIMEFYQRQLDAKAAEKAANQPAPPVGHLLSTGVTSDMGAAFSPRTPTDKLP